jgi:tetratricopeptide repeat protein
VAVRLNNLAVLRQYTNRQSDAEPLMRRALAIDERSIGPEHPKVAILFSNLAQLNAELSHWQKLPGCTGAPSQSSPLLPAARKVSTVVG